MTVRGGTYRSEPYSSSITPSYPFLVPRDGFTSVTMPDEVADALIERRQELGLSWSKFGPQIVEALDGTGAPSGTVDLSGEDAFIQRVAAELAEEVSLEVTVEPGDAMMADLDQAVRTAARDAFRDTLEAAKGGRL